MVSALHNTITFGHHVSGPQINSIATKRQWPLVWLIAGTSTASTFLHALKWSNIRESYNRRLFHYPFYVLPKEPTFRRRNQLLCR